MVCQGRGGSKSIQALRESIEQGRKHGYRLAPEPAQALPLSAGRPAACSGRTSCSPSSAATTRSSPRSTPRATTTGSWSCRAPTPSPPHGRAAQRSALQAPHPAGLRRRQDAELPLSGHLSQRSEPDPRPGPGSARPPPPSPPLANRQGIPDNGALRALQPPARGHRRQAHRRDRRRRLGLRVRRPGGAAAHAPQARDRPRRPRRRLRGAQLHRPRRARARHLHRGDRRLPDRHREDVLGRRLRQPDLHLRPRPVHRLRGVRLR